MLLAKEFAISPPATVPPRPRPSARIPPRGFAAALPDLWLRTEGAGARTAPAPAGSHDSDLDLAMLVTDFLENGGTGGGDSAGTSDSDSDLAHLADTISMYNQGADDKENELLSVVHSLLLSIHESELQPFKTVGQCTGSCIRHLLASLLKYSGYDAAVCTSKWQGFHKIPGGDHEYIDVLMKSDITGPERLIIDIDFRSHFEIARAVDSYGSLLNSLPVVFVGTLPRLKQFLHVMVDAAKWSLKQNSMPLPPWRSLPYLQAKWQSKYDRRDLNTAQGLHTTASDHTLCIGHLKRLKTSLQSELETGRLLMMPIKAEKKRMTKSERRWRQHSLLNC